MSGENEENHEKTSLGSESRGRHSNVGPPKYEAELLAIGSRCSITLLTIRLKEQTSIASFVLQNRNPI